MNILTCIPHSTGEHYYEKLQNSKIVLHNNKRKIVLIGKICCLKKYWQSCSTLYRYVLYYLSCRVKCEVNDYSKGNI